MESHVVFLEPEIQHVPVSFMFRLIVWDGSRLQIWRCQGLFPTSDIELNPALGIRHAAHTAAIMQTKVLHEGQFTCSGVGCFAKVDTDTGGCLRVDWAKLVPDAEDIELIARAVPLCHKCK